MSKLQTIQLSRMLNWRTQQKQDIIMIYQQDFSEFSRQFFQFIAYVHSYNIIQSKQQRSLNIKISQTMDVFSKNLRKNSNNQYQYNNNSYNYVNPNQQILEKQGGKINMTMMSPQLQNFYAPNQNHSVNDLDPQAVIRAINNSYMQRMSGAPTVQLTDILALVTRTAQQVSRFSMLKFGKIQDVKYFWRIVELDQSSIFKQSIFFELNSCKSCSNQNKNVKLYQLLMSLDGKQMRLQSMQDRDKCFNVNFDTVQCKLIPGLKDEDIIIIVGKKYQIKVSVSGATIPFYFRDSLSKLQLQKQIKRLSSELKLTLKMAIDKSRGLQFSLQSLLEKQKNFFKKHYATEQQFAQYCQTGDVLLFKDSHTFAQIQRAVTNSQYDHVGVVYRSQKYGICIFQSSSAIGVSLAVWTHLIRHNWFKGIQSISWRRLLIHDKPKDYQQQVTSFINSNLNKKFDISVGKLMKFRSTIGQSSPQQQKNKTYFCSQLVATLYKKLGLLDEKVSATQYWPKHFSDKGHISMLKNSALQHQRELIFQQKILKQNYKFYK